MCPSAPPHVQNELHQLTLTGTWPFWARLLFQDPVQTAVHLSASGTSRVLSRLWRSFKEGGFGIASGGMKGIRLHLNKEGKSYAAGPWDDISVQAAHFAVGCVKTLEVACVLGECSPRFERCFQPVWVWRASLNFTESACTSSVNNTESQKSGRLMLMEHRLLSVISLLYFISSFQILRKTRVDTQPRVPTGLDSWKGWLCTLALMQTVAPAWRLPTGAGICCHVQNLSRMRTHTSMHTYKCIHKHTNTQTQNLTHRHTNTQTQNLTHTQTQRHKTSHTQAQKHTDTKPHTHTHKQTHRH